MAIRLQVSIDPERCVGYGRCAAVATGVFMIDEDTAKAYLDDAAAAEASDSTMFAAARACPTQAIIIEQLGQRIYPRILAPMLAEIQRQLQELESEGSE